LTRRASTAFESTLELEVFLVLASQGVFFVVVGACAQSGEQALYRLFLFFGGDCLRFNRNAIVGLIASLQIEIGLVLNEPVVRGDENVLPVFPDTTSLAESIQHVLHLVGGKPRLSGDGNVNARSVEACIVPLSKT